MGSLVLAAVLYLLLVPTGEPHSRLLANEVSAVTKLRTIITLQDEYTAAHAHTGFACEPGLSSTSTTDGDGRQQIQAIFVRVSTPSFEFFSSNVLACRLRKAQTEVDIRKTTA
jgi:hypothetical protein